METYANLLPLSLASVDFDTTSSHSTLFLGLLMGLAIGDKGFRIVGIGKP